jgi:carboxypeptidase PM20D1
LAVCDEEIAGKNGAATMVAKLFEESLFGNDFEEPPIVLDEGGYWIRGLFRKPILNVAVTEKRQMVLKISFYGKSGHGALPPKPTDNAKLKAAKAEIALAAAERPLLLNPVTKETIGLIRKLKMGGLPLPVGAIAALASRTNSKIYALTHDTIASTTEESDADINVVPAVVTKYLDIRLLPTTNPTEMIEFLKKVLIENAGLAFGKDFDLEVVRNPIQSAVSSIGKVIDVIREKVRLYDADTEVVVAQCPGFTDSRWFRAVGCEAYGILPVPLSEDELDNIHGKQERISMDGFRMGINLIYEIVANLIK